MFLSKIINLLLQFIKIVYNICRSSYDHIISYIELINVVLNRIVVNPDVSGKLVQFDWR